MKEVDYLEFAEYFRDTFEPTEWKGYFVRMAMDYGQRNLKENWFKMDKIFDNWKKYWWSRRKTQRTRNHD